LDSSSSVPILANSKQPKSQIEHTSESVVVLSKFYPRPFTKKILTEYLFIWEGTKGNLWRYDKNEGIWVSDGEDFIRLYFRRLSDCIDDTNKKRHPIDEIIADVQGYTFKSKGLPESDVNLIPFKNGVYDLSRNVFREFHAEDYFTWKLPHKYNPDAMCEYLQGLIESFLTDSETITLWELLAYTLWRTYPYQRFFPFIGPGCNGKTLFSKVMTKLLGVENVSHVSMEDIQNNRFAAANLHRKLVNISGEVSYESLRNTSLLKQLSGEDYINADVKFKKPIKFKNYAKLVFLTNQMPVTRDTTDAFYRRVFLVEFPKQFADDPSVPIKIDGLPEEEFEGLLFLVLQKLKNLHKQGFIFTRHQDIGSIKERYEYLSNPIFRFVTENCEVEQDSFIYKFEFLDKLNEWLTIKGFNKYSSERVGREMKTMGFSDAQKGEKRIRAWVGIRWRDSTHKTAEEMVYVDTEVE
jgi:putative DNA primase/helicase